MAKRVKHITITAKQLYRWSFVHDEVGYNYRLPNLNAALGCEQLEQLPGFLRDKRLLFEQHRTAFNKVPGMNLVSEPAGCKSNYWLQALLLDAANPDQRDAVLTAANDAGMMTRPFWELMPSLPMHGNNPKAPIPVSESLEQRLINIPSSSGLI